MKHKVYTENIPDKYQCLVKEEMTNKEISVMGTIILKDKLHNLKQKILGWYHGKKNKSC